MISTSPGSPAERVAHRNQLPFAHDQQRKRALNPAQRSEHIGAIVRWLREQMQNDLAIGCCLEDGAFPLQFIAQKIRINQITIVRNGHLTPHTIHHEGLRIFDRTRPSR